MAFGTGSFFESSGTVLPFFQRSYSGETLVFSVPHHPHTRKTVPRGDTRADHIRSCIVPLRGRFSVQEGNVCKGNRRGFAEAGLPEAAENRPQR